MAELGDVIAREAYTSRRFDLFPFQQNPQLLVANLCALLKRDSIHTGEHQSRYNERDARSFLPRCCNGEVEAARAVFNGFKSQIPDILLCVFHNSGFIILDVMSLGGQNREIARTWKYHDATKHSEWSIRSSPHYLDWSNQPLPLKIYTTIDPIPLPRDADQTGIAALSAIEAADVGADMERIPGLRDLARILYFSAGITKKKTYPGGEIYFRAASCTGALYEFELYIVSGDLPDLKAGVYHFGPGDFALRQLRGGDHRGILVQATAGEPTLSHAPAVMIGAGTHCRNAWK